MTGYHAINIVLNEEADSDLLIGLLSIFDCVGFEEEEGLLVAYILSANLPSAADLKAVLKGFTFNVQEIADQNWNAVWEESYAPVLIGDFCGIRADFHPPFQKVLHELVINPRMSFGTGHHATTRMMIKLMQSLDLKGKSVLDFGTGTGILSILASKMDAEEVVAIDNDANAVENALQNVQANQVGRIKIYCQGLFGMERKNYDLILANINKNIILDACETLVTQLSAEGHILVSGFLKKDREAITDTFQRKGCQVKRELQEGKWVAMEWQKNNV